MAAFGCTVWRALDAGRRRNARTNYAAALGLPEDDPAVDRVAGRAFANYGRMLADFLLIGSLSADEVRGIVDVEGYEHVGPVMAQGRGAILALPHMGSWDFAAALATVIGHRLAAVVETFPGSLNEAVVETRSRHGLQVIPMGRAAVRAINAVLDENGMVALVCDLPQGPGLEVGFFGHRAIVPSGPAAIACRRSAPILPLYSRRAEGHRYVIHVDPPITPPPPERCRDKAAITETMQQIVERFEGFIRQHPDQWYAFRSILN